MGLGKLAAGGGFDIEYKMEYNSPAQRVSRDTLTIHISRGIKGDMEYGQNLC
jgi:hypothetical protein